MFGFAPEFRFELPHIGARGAFLRRGDLRVELFAYPNSAPTPPERRKPDTDLAVQGTKHLGFAVGDLPAALERLHFAGVEIAGVRRRNGPMREEADPRLDKAAPMAVFVRSPEGALIEMVAQGDFAP